MRVSTHPEAGRVAVSLWRDDACTAHRFLAGHSLRLLVAGGAHPRYASLDHPAAGLRLTGPLVGLLRSLRRRRTTRGGLVPERLF